MDIFLSHIMNTHGSGPRADPALLPEPIPRIRKKHLYPLLLAPPLATILAVCGLITTWVDIGIIVPVVVLILVLTGRFHNVVAVRYRGRSLVFLVFAYGLGQFIGCFILLFATFFLFELAMRFL